MNPSDEKAETGQEDARRQLCKLEAELQTGIEVKHAFAPGLFEVQILWSDPPFVCLRSAGSDLRAYHIVDGRADAATDRFPLQGEDAYCDRFAALLAARVTKEIVLEARALECIARGEQE